MKTKLSIQSMIGIALAVLIGLGFLVRHQAKGMTEKSQVLQEETEKQRQAMKAAYDRRAEILKGWLGKAKNLRDKNFNEVSFGNALEETQVNPLKSQVDFDRFDWVQNDISNQAAILAGVLLKSNSAEASAHVRELESIEREIIKSRQQYHEAAFQFNALATGVNSLVAKALVHIHPMPVFKVESAMQKEKRNEVK